MLLDESSPLGAFSKILLASPLFTHSEEFCYVWEIWDTRLDCSAFQLTVLGQNIGDSGCSLWRTPVQGEKGTSSSTLEYLKTYKNGVRGVHSLSTQAAYPQLWRTPNTQMVSGGGMDGEKRLAQGHALQLTDQAKTPKLWPTPTQRDWKSCSHGNQDNARPLSEVAGLTGSGSLNPRFVEELMGFPIDHTALKRSGTPSFRSKPIHSSKRSRKSKGGIKVELTDGVNVDII
jgi:hypothetical protein